SVLEGDRRRRGTRGCQGVQGSRPVKFDAPERCACHFYWTGEQVSCILPFLVLEGKVGRELPDSSMRQLDAEVARLARSAGRLRLVFGEALCVVAARSVQHELGFSSLGAYAQERLDVAVRWALDSQALARRLEQLPQLRQAVFSGELGWSRAELLARLIERSVSGAAALAEVDSCAGEANGAQRRNGGV